MLPRPFKVTKIGPVNLFVADVDASERFYTELLGLTKTEDVQFRGQRCVFLRCGTDHHTIGLVSGGAAFRAWAQSRDDADEHRHAGRDLPSASGRDRVPARAGPAVHRRASRAICIPASTMRRTPSALTAIAFSSITAWSRSAGTAGRVRRRSGRASCPIGRRRWKGHLPAMSTRSCRDRSGSDDPASAGMKNDRIAGECDERCVQGPA